MELSEQQFPSVNNIPLYDGLRPEVQAIFQGAWTPQRTSSNVPEPQDVRLDRNDGITIDAAVLYADLAESTNMVDNFLPNFAAEVYKAYLRCAARAITHNSGQITSYDGDRIMGVFVGNDKESRAVYAGMEIAWAVTHIVNEEMRSFYGTNLAVDFKVKQAVGIDTGKLLAARTGVRGNNDLVWVGRPANYAAKLCGRRTDYLATWITEDVYTALNFYARVGRDGLDMWQHQEWWGERGIYIRGSSYYFLPT